MLRADQDAPTEVMSTFGYRAVLHVDAVDAGESFGLLHRAVDQVGIVTVGL